MENKFGQFGTEAYELFLEMATEEYVFGSCKSGEKMTFGKCQKVGGSSKNQEAKDRLNKMKATAERNLAVAKKNKNKKQIKMFTSHINSYNKQLASL